MTVKALPNGVAQARAQSSAAVRPPQPWGRLRGRSICLSVNSVAGLWRGRRGSWGAAGMLGTVIWGGSQPFARWYRAPPVCSGKRPGCTHALGPTRRPLRPGRPAGVVLLPLCRGCAPATPAAPAAPRRAAAGAPSSARAQLDHAGPATSGRCTRLAEDEPCGDLGASPPLVGAWLWQREAPRS